MLDNTFSFIDPVFSTDANSLSEFIFQMEAFFASMEQKGKTSIVPPQSLTEETYKEM